MPTSAISARRFSSSCMNVLGHLLELLDARLVVVAVDVHRLDLLVEVLDHRVQAPAERTAARRALAVFAECDDAIALLLELGVLLAQRFALGLRLLAVAHPLGAARLELSLRVLELGALLLQLERRLFLERGRALDSRVTLVRRAISSRERASASSSVLRRPSSRESVFERLELDVEREQRLDGVAQRGELRRARSALPRARALTRSASRCERRFLLFRHARSA